MTRIIVDDIALRELVGEALDGGHLGDLTMPEDEQPVSVNAVVDPSASLTDPINAKFIPQTKPELDVAVKQLTDDIPIDRVAAVYKAISSVIEDIVDEQENIESKKEMKNTKKDDAKRVEEAIRTEINKVLKQMTEAPGDLPPVKKIPYGTHGAEYMRRVEKAKSDLKKSFRSGIIDEPEEVGDVSDDEPKKRHAFKSTALGNMADVSGASFQDIAKELGFSVAGAKQAVDKALEKARWVSAELDPDELEIIVLTTMKDYIDVLNKTGKLTAGDVQLMKDHPDIVRELDGFREFLATTLKRRRKAGQKLQNPLGESQNLEMLTCPDCNGTGWDSDNDKDCELCAGHGQISRRDLYGEAKHLKTVVEALNSVGIKAKISKKRR